MLTLPKANAFNLPSNKMNN